MVGSLFVQIMRPKAFGHLSLLGSFIFLFLSWKETILATRGCVLAHL